MSTLNFVILLSVMRQLNFMLYATFAIAMLDQCLSWNCSRWKSDVQNCRKGKIYKNLAKFSRKKLLKSRPNWQCNIWGGVLLHCLWGRRPRHLCACSLWVNDGLYKNDLNIAMFLFVCFGCLQSTRKSVRVSVTLALNLMQTLTWF